jgi:hypothetical protein
VLCAFAVPGLPPKAAEFLVRAVFRNIARFERLSAKKGGQEIEDAVLGRDVPKYLRTARREGKKMATETGNATRQKTPRKKKPQPKPKEDNKPAPKQSN